MNHVPARIRRVVYGAGRPARFVGALLAMAVMTWPALAGAVVAEWSGDMPDPVEIVRTLMCLVAAWHGPNPHAIDILPCFIKW